MATAKSARKCIPVRPVCVSLKMRKPRSHAPIASRYRPGHCRAPAGLEPKFEPKFGPKLGLEVGSGSPGPGEMNIAERDAVRAAKAASEKAADDRIVIGTAAPDVAPASEPARGSKLRPLLSLVPYVLRYRWHAGGALVALLVSLHPAWRATRIDAAEVLRAG